MPRTYKGQPLSVGLNPRTTKPLDTRSVIDTASDRLLPATWKEDDGNCYVYPGMQVSCADSGQIYVYVGRENNVVDIADESKWITPVGGLGMVLLEKEDVEKLVPAQCEENVLYIGLEPIVNIWRFGDKFPIRFT